MKKITLIFEDPLHQAFKIKCVKEDTSMQQKLIELVNEYLKKENK